MNEKSLIARSIKVIDLVSRYEEGIRYSQIDAAFDGLSPTTLSKILRELAENKVIEKTGNGTYILSRKVFYWGQSVKNEQSIMQVLHEELLHLNHVLKASANCFTHIEGTMFCLDRIDEPNSPSLLAAGKKVRIGIGVLGAVFFKPEKMWGCKDKIEAEIRKKGFKAGTDDVKRMISRALAEDYQDDEGLFFPGSRRFAVPIRLGGNTVYVLGIGIMSVRLEEEGLYEKIKAELFASRQRIEKNSNGG